MSSLSMYREETCDPASTASKTEKTQLLRTFYRFQLCCNLFGMGLYGISWHQRLDFRPVDILKIFICLFEPWEVEEIACIYTFSKEKYNQIFCDIRWDVHEENPKFEDQPPPTPDGAYDLDNSFLFTVRDHAHLVSTMQKHISCPAGKFLEGEALGETAQFQRRQEQLSNLDKKQQRCDPLPFKGNGEAHTRELRPPLAWTATCTDTNVKDVIRRWGYVMWDAARLERTGTKEVLLRQWKAYWEDSDPRDNML